MAKVKFVQAVKMVTDCLQELFYVTDGELVAKTLDPHWLTPNDVMMDVQARYGIFLPKREYVSWNDFIRTAAHAVVVYYKT